MLIWNSKIEAKNMLRTLFCLGLTVGKWYYCDRGFNSKLPIAHFRVLVCLCVKTCLSATLFLWKRVWPTSSFSCKLKLVFIWQVLHEDSFWDRNKTKLGIGLLQPVKIRYQRFRFSISEVWFPTIEQKDKCKDSILEQVNCVSWRSKLSTITAWITIWQS